MNTHRCHAATVTKGTGCKESYSLMKLPNHDHVEQTVSDAMHTIKDVVEKLFNVVTGRGRADTSKVKGAEAALGRFGMGSADQSISKLSGAPFQLSRDQMKEAELRTQSILVPVYLDFKPAQLFPKSARLKSHDWKQVCGFCFNYNCAMMMNVSCNDNTLQLQLILYVCAIGTRCTSVIYHLR